MRPTVVILLSDKRSGSTMFQRELCKHPAIQTVVYSPHTYLETHHWLKAAVLLEKAPATFAGGKTYRGYGSKANARAYLIDCIKKNVPDFHVPQNDRALVFEGWEALCKKYTQPVFFEKSPQFLAQWGALSLLLEWIQQTNFQVKIIGLTRNPMAVQYSAYQLFHTNPENRQFGWLHTQRNLLAFESLLPANSFMAVQYEQITQEPSNTFNKICDFIGVSPHSEMGQKVHDQSLNKWIEDPFFQLQLDETIKQLARHFGYNEKDLFNPKKPEPPFYKRVLRKGKGWLKLFKSRVRDRYIIPIKNKLIQ